MSAPVPGRQPRPYAATGGRTRAPGGTIGFDTQITAHHSAHGRLLSDQHQGVLAACATPAAVAELSARLNLPVGVVTVLVDDLVAARLVQAQAPFDVASDSNVSHELLRRVREGLIQSREIDTERGVRRAN